MKKYLLCCFIFTCFSQSLLAATSLVNSPHGWYIGVNAGATFPKNDVDNFLTTSAGWPDDQFHYSQAKSAALLSLLGGYTWMTSKNWFPFFSLGGSYNYVLPSKISGKIRQYSLAQFENYDFQYQIQRQTFLAVFKADIYRCGNLMPFLDAGTGFSLVKASSYSEQALANVTPRVSPGFGHHINTNFSYTVGVGLDYIVQKNFLLSVAYNHGHFGRVQTGYATDGYTGQRLVTKLQSNTVTLSVNYFLDKSI